MLVIELAPVGSLLDVLGRATARSLGWRARVGIAAGTACGVEFLHAQQPPIIHHDLKSANVVLSDSVPPMPKLCDFGLSRVLPSLGVGPSGQQDAHAPVQVGTPKYMAPEVVLAQRISRPKAIDCYGLGVVLHDLTSLGFDGTCTPMRPLDGASLAIASAAGLSEGTGVHVLYARASVDFAVALPPHCPPPLAQLLLRCLAVPPEARPESGEVRSELLALVELADAWPLPP
jgi:serine/threonine protein kinase